MTAEMEPCSEFFIADRERAANRYHYTESGLDDVYLLNGFKYEEHDGEQAVIISNIDGLHAAIALYLISYRKALNPKELYFLRRELDFTQAELGECLGLSSQQVARWEKGQSEISGAADRLLRIMVRFRTLPESAKAEVLRDLMEHLKKLDATDELASGKQVVFVERDEQWKQAA